MCSKNAKHLWYYHKVYENRHTKKCLISVQLLPSKIPSFVQGMQLSFCVEVICKQSLFNLIEIGGNLVQTVLKQIYPIII